MPQAKKKNRKTLGRCPAEQSETGLPFSDVSPEDWAAPYILGSMEQGFFAGDEEGLFRPQVQKGDAGGFIGG